MGKLSITPNYATMIGQNNLETILTHTSNAVVRTGKFSVPNPRFPTLFINWKAGESTAISTLTNGNWMIFHGVLQYSYGNVMDRNFGISWLPNEDNLFPNPVKNLLENNFKHLVPGIIYFELFNNTKPREVKIANRLTKNYANIN